MKNNLKLLKCNHEAGRQLGQVVKNSEVAGSSLALTTKTGVVSIGRP